MRIRLVGTQRHDDGRVSVAFQSAAGNARAYWRSKQHEAVPGKMYDAELDIEERADTGNNAKLCAAEIPLGISIAGDTVVLRARVESIDDDGMAYLRLSDDCLMMVEFTGSVSAGDTIEILVPQTSVAVTPIGCL